MLMWTLERVGLRAARAYARPRGRPHASARSTAAGGFEAQRQFQGALAILHAARPVVTTFDAGEKRRR